MPTPSAIPLHPLPVIELSVDIGPMVDALEEALLTMRGAPCVFQRARQLVVIGEGVHPPPWLKRPVDAPVILEASHAYLRELASQAATFVKYSKTSQQPVPVIPPQFLIENIRGRPGWRFPVLDGIVCAPTICPNGTILTTPGYHPESGLYLDLNGTVYPDMPVNPGRDEAHDAAIALLDIFEDFPLVEPWHKSATIAAILSLVARHAVPGNVPLFAVNANTAGSGKGLLIDAISTIATGRPAPCWPQTGDEEEERKRLMTIGLAGDPIVHIDNVTQPFGSGALDSALTTRTIAGRLLGLNEERHVPLDSVFFASGNNMAYRGDLARRIIPIELDPQTERPEERHGFAHSPLLPWVLEQRPELVIKALTILLAYLEGGKEKQGLSPLGSFEEWSDLIRSALVWAGMKDPCEGRRNTTSEADPEVDTLQTLLNGWYACYGTNAKTLQAVNQDINMYTSGLTPLQSYVELRDALGSLDPRWNGGKLNLRVIGWGLNKRRGRRLGDRRFEQETAAQGGHAAKWKIHEFKAGN